MMKCYKKIIRDIQKTSFEENKNTIKKVPSVKDTEVRVMTRVSYNMLCKTYNNDHLITKHKRIYTHMSSNVLSYNVVTQASQAEKIYELPFTAVASKPTSVQRKYIPYVKICQRQVKYNFINEPH